jgi:hypothetical protein
MAMQPPQGMPYQHPAAQQRDPLAAATQRVARLEDDRRLGVYGKFYAPMMLMSFVFLFLTYYQDDDEGAASYLALWEIAANGAGVGVVAVMLMLVVVALLAVLGVFVPAASSQSQTPRGTKEFRATKDCSGFTGLAGGSCTIRSSNVKALKVGSKIFYVQKAGKTALDSDSVIYVKRGSVATGHCLLRFKTGVGLCTISDGTGTLAGFRLRVRVTASSSIPNLWHWDGTYSFNRG